MTDAAAELTLGLKNVLGSNWTRGDRAWRHRARLLDAEMHAPEGMRASVYFLLEVNSCRQRHSLRRMLRGWDTVRTRGHNDVHSDPASHRLLWHREIALGTRTQQERYATIVRWAHLGSGIEWTAATTHLSSSVNTTIALAEASRELQARRLVEACHDHDVDVIAGDLNNVAVRPDTPRGIIEAAGYRDWRGLGAVGDVDHDSHYTLGQPAPRTGRHLDAIYLAPRVSLVTGRLQVTQPDSSDHFGLVCTVSIAPR